MKVMLSRDVFMKRLAAIFTLLFICALSYAPAVRVLAVERNQATEQSSPLHFEIRMKQGLLASPMSGRLFVIISQSAQPEPRLQTGEPGFDAPTVLARDVKGFAPGGAHTLDQSATIFPIETLSRLKVGDYFVQAVFDFNQDLRSMNSPGNLFSQPQRIHVDPSQAGPISLELTKQVPPEELPADTESVRYIKMQSALLTKFFGRPMFLRAGVILPKDFEKETDRRYPLRVNIGGYGTRYTIVGRLVNTANFRGAWLASDAPRMIYLQLDGAGPFGDPYQVNSANNGPYGDAVTQELIPYVEKRFRGIGQPYARVLSGGSTGGWVSLALQIFYPDFFNGTWSGYPDGVDFRAFQLVNIYKDENAYVNEFGFERPSARTLLGDVKYTMRHECQMENVLGAGDSYTMSGQQWGAWNAVYGPRGADGRPVPIWDAKTGVINHAAAEQWKKYDLRLILENNWATLGPKLRGKFHIWVGEADDYFLNNGVHLLDTFLSKANPPFKGRIVYGPGKGHGWTPQTERQMMDEMAAAMKSKEAEGSSRRQE